MFINIIIIFLIICIAMTVVYLIFAPKEKVFLREKMLYMKTPIELEGKPDLVTIEKKQLRVYDLKNRNISKVFFSDLVQLTAYKMLLESVYKKKVIEGYVIINNNNFQKKIKINFLSEQEIIKIYQRNQFLQQNPQEAAWCKNKNICFSCHFYQKKCFPQ